MWEPILAGWKRSRWRATPRPKAKITELYRFTARHYRDINRLGPTPTSVANPDHAALPAFGRIPPLPYLAEPREGTSWLVRSMAFWWWRWSRRWRRRLPPAVSPMPARASSRSSAPKAISRRYYDRAAQGQSAYFVWLNRGKESLALDIKARRRPRAPRRASSRAPTCSSRILRRAPRRGPASIRRSYARRFPRLIACSISGYGEDGPYRDMKAYDLLIQGETGLAAITGSPEGPGRVGVSVSDIAAGLNAYAAILEALYARERTGEGALIAYRRCSMRPRNGWRCRCSITIMRGKAPARVGLRHPSIAPYGAFPTGDGKRSSRHPERARMGALLRRRPGRRRARERSAVLPTTRSRVANRAALDAI